MFSEATVRRVPVLRVLASMFVYRLGKSVAGITVPWLLLSLSRSSVWVGATVAGIGIATILGTLCGGSLADRIGPRTVLSGAAVTGGLAVAAVAILCAMGAATTGVVVTLLVLGSLLDAPIMVAQDVRMPELARLARLPLGRVTAAKSMAGHFAAFAGPALAGVVIVHMGTEGALWVVVFCLIPVAWLTAPVMRARPRPQVAQSADGPGAMSAGVRLLWRDDMLRPLTVLTTVFVAVMTPVVSVIAPTLLHQAGRDAADYGAFMSGIGAGAVLGTMIYAVIEARLSPRWTLAAGFIIYAGVFPLLILVPSTGALAIMGFCAGVAAGPVAPIFNKLLYQRAPLQLRGRVIAAYSGIVMAAVPLAVVFGGVGTRLLGADTVLCAATIVAAGAGLMSLRLSQWS